MRLISFDRRVNKFYVDLYLEQNRDNSLLCIDDTDMSRDAILDTNLINIWFPKILLEIIKS